MGDSRPARARHRGRPIRIVYLTYDLDDPPTGRRILMLRAGGADVLAAGFRRGADAPARIEGAPVFHFGRTIATKLLRRIPVIVAAAFGVGRFRRFAGDADVFVCRNLEVLAIAWLAKALYLPRAALVYECLDVHRMMLGRGPVSGLLRAAERWLLARCRWLLTSSPGFVDCYFKPRQGYAGPVLLVENQALALAPHVAAAPPAPPPPGPPWRIGWFGTIRCRKSLHLLAELVRRSEGAVEVVIRGRPARFEICDFDEVVAATPGLSFQGAYGYDELGAIYGETHFAWAIDYFETGTNSAWLLPNRIYEGGLYGAVAIALSGTETARWLARNGIGVTVDAPLEELLRFFRALTPEAYAALRSAVKALPASTFSADEARCRRLVEALAGRLPDPPEALTPLRG
jgi:hypothetical protein